jgi:hypothetical protein
MFTGGAYSSTLIPVNENAVENWSSESSNLRDKYNAELDTLLELYEIVANFIKRNERILVGGMAIDYSLRLKGKELYNVEKIDYDFISPEYHKDAYELGNEIAKKYDHVSVICAKHISTMRVRYKFMAVADITYAPITVYEKIKTLNYQGFKIIHPWFQQVDQLRAMRNMLEGTPKEIVLSDRIEKDTKRFCMLEESYPLEFDSKLLNKEKNVKLKTHKVKLTTEKVLSGFAAAIYWMKKLNIKVNYEFNVVNDEATITLPENQRISWLVDNYPNFDLSNNSNKILEYNPLLDKLYPMKLYNSEEYYNIYGDKQIVECVNGNYIDGIYSTMVWLSTSWLFNNNELASYLYYKLQTKFVKDPTLFVPDFKHLFGKEVITTVLLLTKEKREDPENAKLLLPKNAYPLKGQNVTYDFDLNKSKLLKLDGKLVN